MRHRSENTPRYVVWQEPRGTWTVMDSLTSLPAATDGKDLSGLSKIDAEDIAQELNRSIAGGQDPLV
ncbi:hypothetical protein QTL95_16345 [Rhizobium sp. S152]|uniref:hypothetical protein n=1 Tax=Rhizobium sp. S152 TaxID=3055038 RepID=UPI0025A96AE7|nr:hypothetical protein [Rhizobium sp. S152]MDM9627475.1 hypothetical protein [Rhizobium sp. S152]